MTASEIREAAAKAVRYGILADGTILIEAARAYADLLERGKEVESNGWISTMRGRYLVVRLGESP